MENEKNSDSLEKPEEIIDEIASKLDDIHEGLVGAAASVGFSRDLIKSIRPIWERLGNSDSPDPDVIQLYKETYGFLRTFRDEIHSYPDPTTQIFTMANNTAGTVLSLLSATGTTESFIEGHADAFSPYCPALITSDHHNVYTMRLMAFHEPLGKTYKAIWEVLYATRADPERAALYLMRQSFDHLFDKLAPDDEVRKSPYWKVKEGDRSDQVWREERCVFAARTHIKNKERSDTMIASSKTMLRVYKLLSQAHNRDSITPQKARHALEQMRIFIETWADSVDI